MAWLITRQEGAIKDDISFLEHFGFQLTYCIYNKKYCHKLWYEHSWSIGWILMIPDFQCSAIMGKKQNYPVSINWIGWIGYSLGLFVYIQYFFCFQSGIPWTVIWNFTRKKCWCGLLVNEYDLTLKCLKKVVNHISLLLLNLSFVPYNVSPLWKCNPKKILQDCQWWCCFMV